MAVSPVPPAGPGEVTRMASTELMPRPLLTPQNLPSGGIEGFLICILIRLLLKTQTRWGRNECCWPSASRLGLGQQGSPGAHDCAKGNDDSKREGPFTGARCQGHVPLNSGQLFLVCQVAESQEEEFMRDTAVLDAMAVSANGNSL